MSIKNICTVRGVKVVLHFFLNVFTTLATLVNVARLSDNACVRTQPRLRDKQADQQLLMRHKV